MHGLETYRFPGYNVSRIPHIAAYWLTVGKLLLCIYTILPFCWKASDFVSHSIDLIVISHIRFFEVPCSQCIDGRYMGHLVTNYCLWFNVFHKLRPLLLSRYDYSI